MRGEGFETVHSPRLERNFNYGAVGRGGKQQFGLGATIGAAADVEPQPPTLLKTAGQASGNERQASSCLTAAPLQAECAALARQMADGEILDPAVTAGFGVAQQAATRDNVDVRQQ